MSDENKLYVGGLSPETTTESLKAHFSQFGELLDAIVMMDKATGRSRCFGFVTFQDSQDTNAVVGTSQTIDGRDVTAKKATKDNGPGSKDSGDRGGGKGGDATFNAVKVFVGGLPPSCDLEKLKEYFSQFGSIEDAVVMMDNATQRHRGFGFVTFHESASVENAMNKYETNELEGKWIEVKRCIPQDKMTPGQSKGRGKGDRGGSSNRGGDSRDSRDSRGGDGASPYGQPGPAGYPSSSAGAYGYGYGAYGSAGYNGAYGAYGGYSPYGPPPAYGSYGPPAAYSAPPGYPGYAPPSAYGAYGSYGSSFGSAYAAAPSSTPSSAHSSPY